jgi:hypothetical protein
MAVDSSPHSLDDIEPDRLYSAVDFARLCPSPKGGHMSTDGVNKMCERGTISARRIQSGDTRGYWVILGAEIIRFTRGEQSAELPITAKRVENAKKRIDALRKKNPSKQAAG